MDIGFDARAGSVGGAGRDVGSAWPCTPFDRPDSYGCVGGRALGGSDCAAYGCAKGTLAGA